MRAVVNDECHVMLFEPASVVNTGYVVNERTVRNLTKIQAGRSPCHLKP